MVFVCLRHLVQRIVLADMDLDFAALPYRKQISHTWPVFSRGW